jgi:hypothetical protein
MNKRKTLGQETLFYAPGKEKLLTTNITKTILTDSLSYLGAKLVHFLESDLLLCYIYFLICFKA